jgi:uncharacterized membrane protein
MKMSLSRWTALIGGLALLGVVVARATRARRRRIAATAASTRVGKTIRVDAEPYDVYAAWRRLERLPEIFASLCAVERLDAVRSYWTAIVEDGVVLRWEAEIVDDVPGELIAWATIDGPIDAVAEVRFSRALIGGTDVVVEVEYRVPERAARLAAPGEALERGLRRLAELVGRRYLQPAYARPSAR